MCAWQLVIVFTRAWFANWPELHLHDMKRFLFFFFLLNKSFCIRSHGYDDTQAAAWLQYAAESVSDTTLGLNVKSVMLP